MFSRFILYLLHIYLIQSYYDLIQVEVVSFDSLNGADVDMPEWMFSKMMRSAKIKYTDHTILRVIQILGKLGNWRRVLQVIEWLQMRERFKSYRLRYHLFPIPLSNVTRHGWSGTYFSVSNRLEDLFGSTGTVVGFFLMCAFKNGVGWIMGSTRSN